jgi:shikimate 5-dehydrogenase
MIKHWYEVRSDYEKVAAFAPSETQGSLEESLERARNVIETTRLGLYRNKVLQIIECKEDEGNPLIATKVIYETHPTVFEEEAPKGCVEPLPAGLFMKEVE